MRKTPLLAALALLAAGCSTKLIRPKSVSLCGNSGCEAVSDEPSRARLLTTMHELFRSAKGRDIVLYSADPRTREEKKEGISFFVQGGPIPGRSSISSLGMVDAMFIDRERSEAKFILKTHATYVGVPVFCAENAALLTVNAEEIKFTGAPFCSWMAISGGIFRLDWNIDFVDAGKGIAAGYWSMHGKGFPLIGGGSGYLVAHFKEAPAAPKPVEAPKPAPVAVARPVAPDGVEVVSQAVRLFLATRLGDENGDLVLQGGEAVTLKVTARNEGTALAAGVEAVLTGEPALTACLGDKKSLGAVAPGEEASAEFSCRLPKQVPSDTVSLRVELFSGRSRAKAAGKVIKIGMSPESEAVEEIVSEIGVDDIPPRSKSGPASGNIAVVVGLGRYREKNIPPVKYAVRDAEVMARYLRNVGGVAADDIKVITDDGATRSDIEAYVEDWLPRRVKPDSTVFFYYAGHGAPEPTGKEAFIVPFEGHPDFPAKLYPLNRLYAGLAKLPAKAVVVMLDSCFSGAKGRGVSQEGARPLVSLQETSGLDPRLAVLTGASGSQVTSDFDKAEHGLFTYFLLKGMRGDADADHDGTVTLGELYPFVRGRVSERASRDLNRDQTPELLGGAGPRASLPVVRR